MTGGTRFVTLGKLFPDILTELSAASSLDCTQKWVFGPYLVLVGHGQRDCLIPQNGSVAWNQNGIQDSRNREPPSSNSSSGY